VDVSMTDNAFAPKSLKVEAGTTVRWVNNGRALHTVTAEDGQFDSDLVRAGAAWSRKLDANGTYNYVCLLHPEMVGSVTVSGGTSSGGTTAGGGPAVGAQGSSGAPSAGPGSASVQMLDNYYAPKSVTVTAGSTVTWTNGGRAMHTVTAKDDSYDSGLVAAGGRYSRTYDDPGAYPYVCTLHPGMEGVVLVRDASGAAPEFDASTLGSGAPATAGAGSARNLAAGEEAPLEVEVRAEDNYFDPENVVVRRGGTVTWLFTGAAPHTATANDGSFHSDIIESGGTFSHTFEAAGVFDYVCALHPEMVGTVEVVDPSVAPPPEAASAEGAGAAGEMRTDDVLEGAARAGLLPGTDSLPVPISATIHGILLLLSVGAVGHLTVRAARFTADTLLS
jgi:plastocyanin